MKENILYLSDSYKHSHHKMYLDGTENVYSYFESRQGAKYPETVFFGLQIYLQKYLEGVVATKQDVDEAEEFCKSHFGMDIFNRKMWDIIVDRHGGKLPIHIKAVPEGTPVPINNVLMTVEATDKDCAPLTNFLETILTHVWYPSNVATISWNLKKTLKDAFDLSADTDDLLPFMLHDFGFRGVSSVESAGMGGAAHLVNFMGTDTLVGIKYAQKYYNATNMPAFSVPASEHSVMTSLGEENEHKIINRLIEKYPDGILSVVSDSYNIERALNLYGNEFKDKILSRNGKFVVRPDSPRFKGENPYEQVLWIASTLERFFGSTKNKKGYKVLNPKVGIIYGDGLSVEEIKDCVHFLILDGWSAETCVYGMGGGLLQKHNRDTQRSAFKCSAQLRDGVWYDICKKPLDKNKKSKAGRLKLVKSIDNQYFTVSEANIAQDELVTVFLNGEITKKYTFNEVRANSNQ